MSIRMVCLALMIVVPGGWKVVMLTAAVLIPFFAVLFANDQKLEAKAPAAPTDVLMLPPGGTTIVMDANGTFHDDAEGAHPDAEDHPDTATDSHHSEESTR